MARRPILQKILGELQYIHYHIDNVEQEITEWKQKPQPTMPESKLLQLPDHLRKTFLAVTSKGRCNASMVSQITCRCRAVESNYLNQLERLDWLVRLPHQADIKGVCFRQKTPHIS